MREKFKNFTFKGSSKVMISKVNEILSDMMSQGYVLTLRQVYYQLVAADVIANRQSEYKRLGSIINDARLGGLIDWDAIEDRTRNIKSVPHWETPADIIRSAADSFRLDKWRGQKRRIEVWVEKDALVGVVERACRELDVKWFSCRGYTSQSAVYNAGKRMNGYIYDGQKPLVIHLGDHDPSGLDMTRDIQDRLFMFVGMPVRVQRIALNMDQIEQYNPPENPAKTTDCRYDKYAEEFGESSWELDALDVRVLHDLITDTVAQYRDDDKFNALASDEKEKRAALSAAADDWQRVEAMLKEFNEEETSKKPKPRKRK